MVSSSEGSPVVFGGIFIGCLVAAVWLGLLDCRPGLAWATWLGLILTAALVFFGDSTGACAGPFIYLFLPFWPLIGLGRLIRIARIRA